MKKKETEKIKFVDGSTKTLPPKPKKKKAISNKKRILTWLIIGFAIGWCIGLTLQDIYGNNNDNITKTVTLDLPEPSSEKPAYENAYNSYQENLKKIELKYGKLNAPGRLWVANQFGQSPFERCPIGPECFKNVN